MADMFTNPANAERQEADGKQPVARDNGSHPHAFADLHRTLVVGLGNPILGDDGVGWRVAEAVDEIIASADTPFGRGGFHAGNGIGTAPAAGAAIEVDCLALGGLSLMERLVGYERVIIIDAIQTRQGHVGEVYKLSLDALPNLSAGHTTAAHDTSLQTALELGRAMGVPLPNDISVVAIEAERVYDFSEELTPAVENAIGPAVAAVLELLVA